MKHREESDILAPLRAHRGNEVTPSPDIRARVMSIIASEESVPSEQNSWKGVMVLAASLFIAALVGLHVGKKNEVPPALSLSAPKLPIPVLFDMAALPGEIEQRVTDVYATEWAHIKGDLAAIEGYFVARLPTGR